MYIIKDYLLDADIYRKINMISSYDNMTYEINESSVVYIMIDIAERNLFAESDMMLSLLPHPRTCLLYRKQSRPRDPIV